MSFPSLLSRRTVAYVLAWTVVVAATGEWTARRRVVAVVADAQLDAQGKAEQLAGGVSEMLAAVRGLAVATRQYHRLADVLKSERGTAGTAGADDETRRELLAARPAVQMMSRMLAGTVGAVSILGGMWLQDADGLIVASADINDPAGRLGRRYPLPQFAARLRSEDEVWMYARSSVSPRPGFVFGAAIMDGRTVLGAVVARADADTITRLLDGKQGDLALLTDSAGRVLASSDARQVLRRVPSIGGVVDTTVAQLPTVSALLGPRFEAPGRDVALRRVWVSAPAGTFGLTLHVIRLLPGAVAVAADTRLITLLVWLCGLLLLGARERGRRQMAIVSAAERRATAEREHVAEILDTSYDAVVTLDAQHRVVDWNARAEAMFGYSASEMVGTDLMTRIVPERWRDRHRDGFATAVRTGRSERFRAPQQLTALNRAGEEFPVELTMGPTREPAYGLMFVAFFRDVSVRDAHERARAAAAARVERYRAVVLDLADGDRDEWAPALRELLRGAMRAMDVERGAYWRLDERMQRITCECQLIAAGEDATSVGLTFGREQCPAYIRALRRRQPIVADDAGQHEATRELAMGYLVPRDIGAVLAAPVWFGARQVGVLTFEHVGGVRAWESETVEFAATMAMQAGALLEFVRRRETECALDAERARMELILRRSPIAQMVWDTATGMVYANPATLTLLKAPATSGLVGTWPWDTAPPVQPDGRDSKAVWQEQMARALHDGQAVFEATHRRLDGTDFPAAVTLDDLRETGRERFISTIIDLTEANAARAAILAAKEAAEQAEAAKSAFLATMSHEIRTPMNGVMSMAEMLEQTDLDEDQRGMLHVVRSSADSLLTIINDILDVSKMEAGKMSIEEVDVTPASLVEDVVQLLAARAQDKQVALYAEVMPSTPALVRGDPTRLRQVVVNLVGNAVKFTERGFVRVRALSAVEGWLRVEVSDTGIGLSRDEREGLFQPFVQADSSTARKFGGSGLGLSICRRLVELMRGRIGVDSVPGAGSTFWFEVPLPPLAPPAAPDVPIADLQVMLIGFPEEQSRIFSGYLETAGAPAPIICERTSDALARLTADAALQPVIVLPSYPDDQQGAGALTVARALRELPGREAMPVGLVVPLTLVSSASAAAYAGIVATTSEPVRRDRFWRMLAVASGRAPAERRVRHHAGQDRWDAPGAVLARSKGAVVLVAEDSRTNQIVISRVLAQLGLVHEIADNGQRALERLTADRQRFGLLLCDFHMPGMDGFELTARWRDLERQGKYQGHLPILALTADVLPGMADRCRAAGMDGYLSKPIVREQLIADLQQWLPVAFELRTEALQDRRRAAAVGQPEDLATDRALREPALVADAAVPAGAEPTEMAPTLDVAEFMARMGLEPGAETDGLLLSGWESMLGLPDALQRAAAARDRTALYDAAHGGKGAARSLGAVMLGDLCAALQATAATMPWEEMAHDVERVLAEHARVGRAMPGGAGTVNT